MLASWKKIRSKKHHLYHKTPPASELCLIFLISKSDVTKFKKPGALHKACWMAKLISSLKAHMVEDQTGLSPDGKSPLVSKSRRQVSLHILLHQFISHGGLEHQIPALHHQVIFFSTSYLTDMLISI